MEALTLDERERIVDSALKIQSVRNSLSFVGENKIPGLREIAACLKSVDHNLRSALGYVRRLRPDGKSPERKSTNVRTSLSEESGTPADVVKDKIPKITND
jgi:hypothetical protein